MRLLARFWIVLAFAFCFQGGIAMSAASAIKYQAVQGGESTPGQSNEAGVAPAAETPWPSCKSMTPIPEVAEVLPPLHTETTQVSGRDEPHGRWRALSIDEPPKTISIAS